MTPSPNAAPRVLLADRHAAVLARINVVTLVVAAVVYVGLVTIAVVERIVPLFVLSSCIMLAEVLVFQFVRTVLEHLRTWREQVR